VTHLIEGSLGPKQYRKVVGQVEAEADEAKTEGQIVMEQQHQREHYFVFLL
jgi:hypothetical protein